MLRDELVESSIDDSKYEKKSKLDNLVGLDGGIFDIYRIIAANILLLFLSYTLLTRPIIFLRKYLLFQLYNSNIYFRLYNSNRLKIQGNDITLL